MATLEMRRPPPVDSLVRSREPEPCRVRTPACLRTPEDARHAFLHDADAAGPPAAGHARRRPAPPGDRDGLDAALDGRSAGDLLLHDDPARHARAEAPAR